MLGEKETTANKKKKNIAYKSSLGTQGKEFFIMHIKLLQSLRTYQDSFFLPILNEDM